MKFLLDTCCISELIKKKPNPGVVQWLMDKNEEDLFLSVITLGEIRKGITKLADLKKKSQLIDWLIELENRFEGRIVPIDSDIAHCWGKVQADLENVGKSMPSIDALIACTALVKNFSIVTHNGKDMIRSHVDLIDPWK